MTTRMEELLTNAEKCFHEERNPFNTEELIAQNMSADECFSLSEAIAHAIRFYLDHKDQATDERMVNVFREALGDDAAKMVAARLKFERDLKALDSKKTS